MAAPDPVLFRFHVFGHALTVTAWTLAAMAPAQTLFTLRTLVQWGLSEKNKRSVSPVSYWWMSLVATTLMIAYSVQRAEIPFLLGYAINLLPYTRNLMLSYGRGKGAGKLTAGACTLVLVALIAYVSPQQAKQMDSRAWFAFGMAGSFVFNSRFIVQWLQSERRGRSEFTLTFWYLSLAGALMLLAYGFVLGDVGFILGYLFNAIPYVRNIMLIRAERRAQAAAG